MEDQKEKIQSVKEWLVAVVAPFLDNPSALSVRPSIDAKGVLFTVKVADLDAGSIIGKGGNHVRSLRALLAGMGKRHDMRASLKLDVPEYKTE